MKRPWKEDTSAGGNAQRLNLDRFARSARATGSIEELVAPMRDLPTLRDKARAVEQAVREHLVDLRAGPATIGLITPTLFHGDADDVAVTVGAACRALGIPFEVVVATNGRAMTCWVRAEVEPGQIVDVDPLGNSNCMRPEG